MRAPQRRQDDRLLLRQRLHKALLHGVQPKGVPGRRFDDQHHHDVTQAGSVGEQPVKNGFVRFRAYLLILRRRERRPDVRAERFFGRVQGASGSA